jgi:hypothetical protein
VHLQSSPTIALERQSAASGGTSPTNFEVVRRSGSELASRTPVEFRLRQLVSLSSAGRHGRASALDPMLHLCAPETRGPQVFSFENHWFVKSVTSTRNSDTLLATSCFSFMDYIRFSLKLRRRAPSQFLAIAGRVQVVRVFCTIHLKSSCISECRFSFPHQPRRT